MQIKCCKCGCSYDPVYYASEKINRPFIECPCCGYRHIIEFHPFESEEKKKTINELDLGGGPYYTVLGGDRIADITGSDQSGSDGNPVTGWDTDSEFIVAVNINSSNKDTESSTYRLYWQDLDDGGGYGLIGSTGELNYSLTDASWSNGDAVTSAQAICTSQESTYVDGVRVRETDTSNAVDLSANQEHENWWGVNPGSADASHEYGFQVYAVAEGAIMGTLVVTITMAAAAQNDSTDETATINEAQTAVKVMSASVAETATIDETPSVQAEFNSAVDETATIDETPAAQAEFNDSVDETATADDAPSASHVQSDSVDETATIDESQSVASVYGDVTDETATIDETPSAVKVMSASVEETADIGEEQSVQAEYNDSVDETATIDETPSASHVRSDSVDETATVDESQSADKVLSATVDETATIDESQDANEINLAVGEETADIGEEQSAIRHLSASVIESMSIDDTPDGTIESGEQSGVVDETATIDDAPVARMIFYASVTESLAINETPGVQAEFNAVVNETADIGEEQSATGLLVPPTGRVKGRIDVLEVKGKIS